MKINPLNITNFDRTYSELQAFWIFCVVVAGRNADFAARSVAALLSRRGSMTPFNYLKSLGEHGVHNCLVAHRVGQYTRISKALNESLNLDLRKVSLEQLMAIHGVGPKTARFFLLHSRPGLDLAVLDTHILAWLRDKGIETPPSTPGNMERYEELERLFIHMRKACFPSMAPAQADLLIWATQSGRLQETPQPALP